MRRDKKGSSGEDGIEGTGWVPINSRPAPGIADFVRPGQRRSEPARDARFRASTRKLFIEAAEKSSTSGVDKLARNFERWGKSRDKPLVPGVKEPNMAIVQDEYKAIQGALGLYRKSRLLGSFVKVAKSLHGRSALAGRLNQRSSSGAGVRKSGMGSLPGVTVRRR